MAVNSVSIAGNLCRDAELRKTKSGASVASFTVAVNEKRKDASEGWVPAPVFVDCALWGARADALARYLTKGLKVAVQGKLHFNQWQDKQTGQTRNKLDVYVNEIELMSKRGDAQPQQEAAPFADADIPF